MPGYKLTDEDMRQIWNNYLCCRCRLVLREPMQLSCGDHVCSSCLDEWKRESRQRAENDWDVVQSLRCPIDRITTMYDDEVFSDKLLMREVRCLRVHCLEHRHGCSWIGQLKDLERHGRDCGFIVIDCECGTKMRRCDLNNHSQNECRARLETCTYCTTRIKLNQMEVHHSTECPAFPTTCQKCNKPNIIRSELDHHWDPELGDCKEALNFCPFMRLGCDQKEPMKRHNWRQHEHDYIQRHLRLLAGLAPDLATREEVNNIREASEMRFESLTEAMRSLEVRARQPQQQVADQNLPPALSSRFYEGRNVNQNDMVVAIKYCIGKLQQLQQNNNALKRQVERHDTSSGDLERRVAELEARQVHSAMQFAAVPDYPRRFEQEVDRHQSQRARSEQRGCAGADFPGRRQQPMYNCTLLWKIDGYARKREAAIRERKTFHSPCFYTSEHGYRMCARIHLDGVDSGKGTHISVFFVVMRGSFDEELRWPFRQKVTIKLFDQDNAKHVTKVFRPDPNGSSFQKPRTEMNVASGYPQFCSLVELNEHAYVRDDVMFIEVVVDTSDL